MTRRTGNDRIYDLDNYANELKVRSKPSLENARKLTEKVKEMRKTISHKGANSVEFSVGDLVLLKSRELEKE